jgi:hypothetical protein
MPKAPDAPEPVQRCPLTFLEYVIERHLGPPSYRGADYAMWVCPFHNDHHPSLSTRPHKREYKDRWNCFGCGERGDEADFLRLYFSNEDYNARLERLRQLRAEYDAMGNAVALSSRGLGSTAGVTILRALFRAGKVDHNDLLEVIAGLNVQRQLRMEQRRLGRTRGAA